MLAQISVSAIYQRNVGAVTDCGDWPYSARCSCHTWSRQSCPPRCNPHYSQWQPPATGLRTSCWSSSWCSCDFPLGTEPWREGLAETGSSQVWKQWNPQKMFSSSSSCSPHIVLVTKHVQLEGGVWLLLPVPLGFVSLLVQRVVQGHHHVLAGVHGLRVLSAEHVVQLGGF